MSEADRRVLRSRRHLIAASVHLDDNLVNEMRERRLITAEQAENLKDEGMSNSERNMRLVEDLLESPTFSLATFCKCIEHYPSLVEELQADLRAEIGALEIEEHVRRDAASMVHKRFGTSRRLSESDKRQIATMIAYKSQIAKETSRRHVISLTAELEKLKDTHKNMETRLQQLNSRIRVFIRQNDLDTMDKFYDMRTTTDVLKGASEDAEPDIMTQLEERCFLLMNKFIRIMAEKESLAKREVRKSEDVSCKEVSIYRNGFSDRQRRPGIINNGSLSDRDLDKMPESPHSNGSCNGNTGLEVRPLMWFTDRRNSHGSSDTEKHLLAAVKGLKRKISLLEDELNLRDIEIESLKAEIQHHEQEISTLRNVLYHSAMDTSHSVETHCDIIGRIRSITNKGKPMLMRSQEDLLRKQGQGETKQLPPLVPKAPVRSLTTLRPSTRHCEGSRPAHDNTII